MKELDFTSATHQLEELYFPVELIPMISEEFLSEDSNRNRIDIKGYFAIVNKRNNECLSVVSSDYRLIPNQEAIAIGRRAFTSLFPSVKEEDLIPYKVIASRRKSFCHIDLVHKEVNFNIFEQDTWFPFIRITNSYNKMYALSFELGFVRKLCSNGVIFNKQTVTVKYNHSYSADPWSIKADITKLKALEKEFMNHMLNLKRFYLPKKYAFPLVCKALSLNYTFLTKESTEDQEKNNPFREAKVQEFFDLKKISNDLISQYATEMGENAMAAFNMISDIISNHDDYNVFNNYASNVKRMNSSLSSWIEQFTQDAEKRNFNIDEYLKDELEYLKVA
jgi:hypothetical protein